MKKVLPIIVLFAGVISIGGYALYVSSPTNTVDVYTEEQPPQKPEEESQKSVENNEDPSSGSDISFGVNIQPKPTDTAQPANTSSTTAPALDESKTPAGRYSTPVFDNVGSVKDITFSTRPAMQLIENSPTDYDLIDDPENTVDLKLNMYYPQNDPLTKRPLLIFVYGGGWWVGDRYQREADAEYFASLGYVTMTIDYTMFPGETVLNPLPTEDLSPYAKIFYESASDLYTAYQYALNNKNVYGIDTSRIGIGGWSAGGLLSHVLVHLEALPTPYGVKAVLGLSNILQADLANFYELSGGFKTFNSSFNPISMFASYDDDIGFAGTPNDHAADCAYLDSIDHTCITVTYPGSGHELDFSAEPALSNAVPFYKQYVAGY